MKKQLIIILVLLVAAVGYYFYALSTDESTPDSQTSEERTMNTDDSAADDDSTDATSPQDTSPTESDTEEETEDNTTDSTGQAGSRDSSEDDTSTDTSNEGSEDELAQDDIVIYTYAASDTSCNSPEPVSPTSLDTRYEFAEVNAVTTLFSGNLPDGYAHIFASGTILRNLQISQGTATVYVNSTFNEGECSTQARTALVQRTLLQFPDIDEVEVVVE